MASTTNFDISSADESIDNATSQNVSINELRPPNQGNTRTPPAARRYQRTRSYDDAYYNRFNKKPPQKPQDSQQSQRPPQSTFQVRNQDQNPNLAPMYFGAPNGDAPNFEPYRRPYDPYYTNGYVYSQPTFMYHAPPPAPTAFEPPAYASNCHFDMSNSGLPLNGLKTGTLALFSDQRRRQFDTIYRSTPLLNYGANSYFGWHQRTPATPTVYRAPMATNPNPVPNQGLSHTVSNGCLDGTDLLPNPFPNGKTAPLTSCSPEMNTNTTGSILFEKETISPFFNDSRAGRQKGNRGNKNRRIGCSPSTSFCGQSWSSSSTGDAAVRRNRIKLCIIMSILVIIVAVLVAMGIAVYSQSKCIVWSIIFRNIRLKLFFKALFFKVS